MAAVEAGDAAPISEELGREKRRGSSSGRGEEAAEHEIAAFAISTQGLSTLTAGLRGAPTLPAPLFDFLFAEMSFSRARAGRLQETLGSVVAALREAGVEVVALKGAALAFFHYPEPGLRPMGDLDLLLREPRDLGRATAVLSRAGWRALFDTPRHRVFARPDERVARPAAEDAGNPVRLEIHTSFRLPVLGRVYDASAALRAQAETRDLDGTPLRDRSGSRAPDTSPLPGGRGLRGERDPGDPGARFPSPRESARRSFAGVSEDTRRLLRVEEEADGQCRPDPVCGGRGETPLPRPSKSFSLGLFFRVIPDAKRARGAAAAPTHPPPAGLVHDAPLACRVAGEQRALPRPDALPDAGRGEGERGAGRDRAVSRRGVDASAPRPRRPPAPRRAALSGRPAASVGRAALAGALAMAAFGIVEIWFTELAVWAFHRAAFAPLERPFAAVLFLSYPLAGALATGLVAAAAGAAGVALEGAAAGASVVLVAHGVFRLPAYAGGSFVLLVSLNAVLLGAALATAVLPRPPRSLAVLAGPWPVALLLGAPPWVMTELLAEASRPVRALGFVVTAGAVATAALAAGRAGPRLRAFAAGLAALATLAAISFADSDPPRQAAVSVAPRMRGPNVLLVVLDTVRADHLSLHGYSRDTTPHLKRFAGSATVYTRAIAPSNMTLASHTVTLTGLAATEHRAHYDAGRPAGRPLGTSMPTLAGVFAERGYDVSSVAGNYGFLGSGFGLDRGFLWNDARARRSTLGVIPATSVRGAFRRFLCRTLGLWPESDARARGAGEIADLAIRRIDRAELLGRPYFLFVNYFDAHERGARPSPWAGKFSTRPARATGALFESMLREMNATGRVSIGERDREDLVARYDETLAYLDGSLGRLLARAAGPNGEKDTLVVVTSDHGEAWGEHDTLGHGSTLYEEQVHVPLVARTPRQAAPRVVETPVGLAGVFGLLTGAADGIRVEDVRRHRARFPLVAAPRPTCSQPSKEIGCSSGGSTAADPGQFGNRRFEQADRAVIVAFGERPDAATEIDRAAAWRQLAVGRARFQLRQSRIQCIAAGHSRGQCKMHVGEMRACLRKVFFAISRNVPPMRLQPGLTGKRQPPQQRGAVGEDVQRRVGPACRLDMLFVDRKRPIKVAFIEVGPGCVKTFFRPQKLHATGDDPRRHDGLSIFLLYRVWSQSGRDLGPR